MTPAASPAPVPTRSEIEAWSTRHLTDAASTWRTAATTSEDAYEQHRQNIATPGGTLWTGDAKDAALSRVTADIGVVSQHSTILREAARIAENGVTDITAAKREVVAAITAAEDDKFRVGEDLSVTDTRTPDIETMAARHTAAVEHAEDIRWNAERLVATDTQIGQRLQATAVDLAGIQFDGEGASQDPLIQAVSNEPDETPADTGEDGQTGADDTDGTEGGGQPNPKDPHPDYPNRSADGTYGPGNSGDGKAAEKAALDERENQTGVPITRQQVRATHPDVKNPDTGEPQQRYYDGLEPTGNPDEYIGIEAKTNESASRPSQERFDDAVTPDRPATAVLDGREIKIVDAQTIYPPEGWQPPSAPAESPALAPVEGAAPGAPHQPVPPGLLGPGSGAKVEGAVPATEAPALPGWGTQLTPQQMIDSGDPALRVLGQELRRRMAEQGIVDPSGLA